MRTSEFSTLLERYRTGRASPDEVRKIEDWYHHIGGNAESLSEKELSFRKKRTLDRILSKTGDQA